MPALPRERVRPLGFIAILAAMAWLLVVWLAAIGPHSAGASDDGLELRHEEMDVLVPWQGQWWYVNIGMFIADDPSEPFDVVVAEAREAMLARFPGAIELGAEDGAVTAQYVLNSYKWSGNSASWAYNSAGKPAALSGDSAAMQAGASAWGSVGASWQFNGGGSTSADTGGCSGSLDGGNTVGWGAQSGSVLAITCSWFNGNVAVEFDMEFDPDWNWTTGSNPTVDLQSVATHEFGHALGLGHSSDNSAVMYFSYSSGSLKRDPQADDIAGVIAKYGSSGGGGATPTNTSAPSATNTPSTTNTPGSTGTPAPTATRTNTPVPTPTTLPGATEPPSSPTPIPTAPPQATATNAPSPTNTRTPTTTPVPPPSLPLLPGANLLAWPGESVPPAQVLAGLGNVIQVVYGWDAAEGRWRRYGPGLPAYANTLGLLQKGDAYWVIARNQASIVIP